MSIADLAHFIKAKQLRRLKKHAKLKMLDIVMPKFKMTTTIDLMPLMKHYGMKTAFEADEADLTGIRYSQKPSTFSSVEPTS